MGADDIARIVPWREHRLPASPWPGTWGFNPTILRVPDGGHAHAGKWLCNLRCANYHLPGSGVQGNSTQSRNGVAQRIRNRNWILTLDPDRGWRPVADVEIEDRSAYAGTRSAQSGHVLGYEDLRLAWSPGDGLVASATTMVCNDDGVLEIAVLDLDEDLQIESVQPLRGAWSERHQKNWMPFLPAPDDRHGRVRWLYSPQTGGVHDREERVVAERRRAVAFTKAAPPKVRHATTFQHGAQTVTLMPGRQRVTPPRQTPLDLRGGTQLVAVPEIGPDRYLGIVHACEIGVTKFYYHFVVVLSGSGDLLSMSRAVKLSPAHGIEFAAGLARDPDSPDRAVVTYGVEDDSARLAETSVRDLLRLAAVL